MRYYNTGYEGSTGARSWPTGEAHSSDVALVMPSVRFLVRVLENLLTSNNTGRPISASGNDFPRKLGQDTAEKLSSWVQAMELQKIGTHPFRHRGSSRDQPRGCAPQGPHSSHWLERPSASRSLRSYLVSVTGGFSALVFGQIDGADSIQSSLDTQKTMDHAK
jgi:hypothetical protein